jgi:hypothetical protein
VEQYGPQVLNEPPFEGFNLAAWVVPALALAAAAWLAGLTVRGRPHETVAAHGAIGAETHPGAAGASSLGPGFPADTALTARLEQMVADES